MRLVPRASVCWSLNQHVWCALKSPPIIVLGRMPSWDRLSGMSCLYVGEVGWGMYRLMILWGVLFMRMLNDCI